SYTPNVSAEALAVALAATPLAPLLRPARGFELLGLRPASAVSGNARGGQATIALAQLMPTQGEDGHFVMYREPIGGALVSTFLAEVAAGQVPRVQGLQ
ncbi:MAG: hypothetical protein RMJ98_21335, partial [Myxococcales bacterium]|nr:hypothetical protein [Polyangiaceae bacterium]MDW8251848.1 hypothetical protein [Myxococcales bacterium]